MLLLLCSGTDHDRHHKDHFNELKCSWKVRWLNTEIINCTPTWNCLGILEVGRKIEQLNMMFGIFFLVCTVSKENVYLLNFSVLNKVFHCVETFCSLGCSCLIYGNKL